MAQKCPLARLFSQHTIAFSGWGEVLRRWALFGIIEKIAAETRREDLMAMDNYETLYRRLVEAALRHDLPGEVDRLRDSREYSAAALNTLLEAGGVAPVVAMGDCTCPEGQAQCELGCLFSAIRRDENGRVIIDADQCVGCGDCVERCRESNLKERRDLVPLIELLQRHDTPVFAMIAPAFLGQFTAEVTVGRLRAAFKRLGFQGMLEVALFADLLTLKEALEYDRIVHDESDFLLTSCCCPMWVAAIRRKYSEFVTHVPPSVSPMVACGRAIKHIHPDAKTVFIGPCLAKKAEAKEADIADAVDFVLTFKEMEQFLEVAGINLTEMPDDQRDHSSRAGRIYARTGGVSEAVASTLSGLKGEHVPLRAFQANGMVECKKLLERLSQGDVPANFLEGMGCVGGCVGGPKVMIPAAEGREHVNEYGDTATYATPLENPYTYTLLKRLGFDTVEALLEHDSMFTRTF